MPRSDHLAIEREVDIMAKFLVLIYGEEARWDAMTDDEGAQIDTAHREFRESASEGSILASGQLDSSSKAKRVGRTGDRSFVTDGPFAEYKEVLGGYYEVEAASLDDAVARAAELAEVRQDHSWVEVWTLVEH